MVLAKAKVTRMRLKLSDLLALLGLLAIAILSLIPRKFNYPDGPLISLDLVVHFGCYCLVGFCALYRRFTFGSAVAAVAALIMFGGVIELVQSQIGRSADVMDFIANTLGALAGYTTVMGLRKVGGAPVHD